MTETMNDKHSIKNLLFSKAVPNYVIPVQTTGYKVFSCIDCGDKFLLKESYEFHINRKSVKITYMCRHCSTLKIFFNRCNLLSHIRSHAFKTATINVSDLNVELLPMSHYQRVDSQIKPKECSTFHNENSQDPTNRKLKIIRCIECKKNIAETGIIYRDRKAHYMQYTNKVYSCPVCLFSLPTICGLASHIRIHTKTPPYYCPECGVYLSYKNAHYPYNHDCEGFKMMRVTARSKCPVSECQLLHPNALRDHLKNNHLKRVHKCSLCNIACFNASTMDRHIKEHNAKAKAAIFYQCEICMGKIVLQKQIDFHLKSHYNNCVYPCWMCGLIFSNVHMLLSHFSKSHTKSREDNMALESIVNSFENSDAAYRVVKKCSKCKRSFKYKCKYDQIHTLPTECPFKYFMKNFKAVEMEPPAQNSNQSNETYSYIVCHLCKNRISPNWEDIKKHYAESHPTYRCLDAKVVLERCRLDDDKTKKTMTKKTIKIKTTTKNKRLKSKSRKRDLIIKKIDVEKKNVSVPNTNIEDGKYVCKCSRLFKNKDKLEEHMKMHRDPYMAYQCMECGQCFVVKSTFSTHLLVEHGIKNVEQYIDSKQCYYENTLEETQDKLIVEEPVHENQCNICREEFNNEHDLQKHFRVHGMAFLMKNKNNSP